MFDDEPPKDEPPRRGRRPQGPDPVQLTFLFLSSLLIAQLASSVLTSRNLYRLLESEVHEPNRRLENRIRKDDARQGSGGAGGLSTGAESAGGGGRD